MIGIIKSSLPDGRSLTAVEALKAAAKLGLQGLLFNSLFDVSPTLDPAELAAARAEANRLGLEISSMLGIVNPALPARSQPIVDAGGGDMQAGVERLVELAASIGIRDMFFIIGMIEDRFEADVSWQAQLDGVAELLGRCAPALRRNGSKLLLKTHEEIATSEIVALVERIGTDVLGVAFDPVNVLCRLEDPVAAARRIAPYAAQLYVDDAVMRFQENGIRRFLAPLGEGFVDWDGISPLLPDAKVWIEMHAGQFAMPVFDRDWLRHQPPVAVEEFASVLAMAAKFGTREVPWDQAAPVARLTQALLRCLS
ncbi:sugar phosphate isomerase/epimerase [Aminobacter aminovorans]|uniref:Hydroxypyruvate isomerase n=1 Tax=Aminobacter aminovorans TaxID=83263 RepID=A0A380WEI2_AMIAI|nr:TIM barrel protein [Aminobacter aminovorans]TCS24029.1 sugar phosphate isomerase/epimerase [Aminobacter aminovorans]SUU87360.1 Hydroxypyruvate isomerase [Aminobacter aminovorans]